MNEPNPTYITICPHCLDDISDRDHPCCTDAELDALREEVKHLRRIAAAAEWYEDSMDWRAGAELGSAIKAARAAGVTWGNE